MNKQIVEILTIAEYITYLQSAIDNADNGPDIKAQVELDAAYEAQDRGVRKVKLTFNRSGANRQWVK